MYTAPSLAMISALGMSIPMLGSGWSPSGVTIVAVLLMAMMGGLLLRERALRLRDHEDLLTAAPKAPSPRRVRGARFARSRATRNPRRSRDGLGEDRRRQFGRQSDTATERDDVGGDDGDDTLWKAIWQRETLDIDKLWREQAGEWDEAWRQQLASANAGPSRSSFAASPSTVSPSAVSPSSTDGGTQ